MTEILGALAIGLSIGFFTAFFWQERRVRRAEHDRDLVIGMRNVIAGRPATAAARAQQEKQEQQAKEFVEAQPSMFGEAFMSEVGDEPKRADERRPAGVDVSSIESRKA